MLHQFWREREDNFLTRAHNINDWQIFIQIYTELMNIWKSYMWTVEWRIIWMKIIAVIIFFRLSFRNCKSCVYNCDDLHSYNKFTLLKILKHCTWKEILLDEDDKPFSKIGSQIISQKYFHILKPPALTRY